LPDYTPTQRKLLIVLSDGLPHTREELHKSLPDDLAIPATLRMHLSNIRKKLHPLGQDILVEHIKGQINYRLVKLMSEVSDE